MIIIETKFHGPTNYKGARVSASSPTWPEARVIISYNYGDGAGDRPSDAHERAAVAYLERVYQKFPGVIPMSIEKNSFGSALMASAGPRGYYFIARSGVE